MRCHKLFPALFFYSFQLLLLSKRPFCCGKKSPNRITSILNVHSSEVCTLHKRIKCYSISDLHADSEKNQLWVQKNCVRSADDENVFTVLILPGDVGSEMDSLRRIFKFLTSCYDAVVFIPGNHEAWRCGIASGGSASIPDERADERLAPDSIVKLSEILLMAKGCGVFVGPLRVYTDNKIDSCVSPLEVPTCEQTERLRVDKSDTSHESHGLRILPDSSSITIFPLYSWYHSSWDTEPGITHPDFLDVEEAIPFQRKWGDFSLCTWPVELESQSNFCSIDGNSTILAESFAAINEPFLHPIRPTVLPKPYKLDEVISTSTTHHDSNDSVLEDLDSAESSLIGSCIGGDNDTVISFSHFLPRQELCPEKRFLLEPLLTRVIGSDFLESQIRRLKPDLHLFGHTHIPIDLDLEGIRYVQWPKGYAR